MTEPNREIPPGRKSAYYVGLGLHVLGLLLFASTFVTFIANFGNSNGFEERARSNGIRAFGGMALMIVGGVVMTIGSKGWAGSGVLIDPQRARKEVEPWSRMAGGMVNDALSEVDVLRPTNAGDRQQPGQVKVRCGTCKAINDEAAKFCNQCGATI